MLKNLSSVLLLHLAQHGKEFFLLNALSIIKHMTIKFFRILLHVLFILSSYSYVKIKFVG
jgi:hypothetical protein